MNKIYFSLITQTIISILTAQTYFEIHMKIVYVYFVILKYDNEKNIFRLSEKIQC